jgi:hypothetical protein
MSWIQGIVTVFCGNLLTLLPMVLNAHGGTKYGIPFPVLARASFGIKVWRDKEERKYIKEGRFKKERSSHINVCLLIPA